MTSEYTSVGLNCEVPEWQVEPSWAIWTSQATGGSHMLIFFTWKLSNIIHYLEFMILYLKHGAAVHYPGHPSLKYT